MIIIIRGHIRNSFETDTLYNFIKVLAYFYDDINIYIHTWNIYANNISWRNISVNNNLVTNEVIYDYFKDYSKLIKHIIIDNDKEINLIGNLEGTINNGPMPIIGWKNYWYGKFQIIDYIYNNVKNPENILNFRFDLFNNSNNNFSLESIINFINNNIYNNFTKNLFLFKEEKYGINNIYLGNVNTMHTLIKKFYYELDDILKIENNTIHQEFLVFRVNNTLFLNTKYQYIVISCNEIRKEKTRELLNIINKQNSHIHYLDATTPLNITNFMKNDINNYSELDLKIISCSKSHLRALEYAIQDDSPEYSIILEDDITFYKNNFSEIINELLIKWETSDLYNNTKMVQIGWVPFNNYKHYESNCESVDTLTTYNSSKILYSFYAFGTQAYIVKKSKLNDIKHVILSESYNQLYNNLSNYNWFNKNTDLIVADHFINRLLNFYIVFPPLVIERQEQSLLGHNNQEEFWDKFFINYESIKQNYLFYTHINYQYIIISINENRRNKTNEILNTVNNSKAKIHNLQGTTSNDNNDFIKNIDNFNFNSKQINEICCIKSHLRALEYALQDDSPEFSIILEDDATFIKKDFDIIINNIINSLINDPEYTNYNLVHIGYVLSRSYYQFLFSSDSKYKQFNNTYKIYNSFYLFGLQGYIVRKSSLHSINNLISCKNYNDYHYIANKYHNTTNCFIAIDHLLNRALSFSIIYPPLVIERDEVSTIGNNNKIDYWNGYFSDFPKEKDKYIL